MGTEYNLYEDTFLGELSISEMSNKLSLDIDTPNKIDQSYYSSIEMTPEDMAKVFLKGLTVCSYWMDTDELKKMILNHIEKEIY